MGLSKSLCFLRNVFLEDADSAVNAKIVLVEGAEKGHDHLRIYTQTPEQREEDVAMMYKVYIEEVEMAKEKI